MDSKPNFAAVDALIERHGKIKLPEEYKKNILDRFGMLESVEIIGSEYSKSIMVPCTMCKHFYRPGDLTTPGSCTICPLVKIFNELEEPMDIVEHSGSPCLLLINEIIAAAFGVEDGSRKVRITSDEVYWSASDEERPMMERAAIKYAIENGIEWV